MRPPDHGEQLDVARPSNGAVLRWTTSAPSGPALPRIGTARKTGKRSSPISAKCLYDAVLLGRLGRYGPHVLDGLARDALADSSRTWPMRRVGEADVAAHHELALVALERGTASTPRPRAGRRSGGRLVEEGQERHRPRGERDEVEDRVEPLVAPFVHLGPARLSCRARQCRAEYRRARRAPSPCDEQGDLSYEGAGAAVPCSCKTGCSRPDP